MPAAGDPLAGSGCLARLFHVTRHADQILAEGFRDSTGDYGFAEVT